MAWDAQDGALIRFDWGPAGVARLARHVDVVVVVDVLRFSTATETAVAHGLAVHPYRWGDGRAAAAEHAAEVEAVLADGRDPGGPSLCPGSLRRLDGVTAVVLPSPNGATCSADAAGAGAEVVAGCLRNAAAVARWVGERASSVAVVACGERSRDGSLRPCIEDLLGAAAILAGLGGERSPEATVAEAALSAALARPDVPGAAGIVDTSRPVARVDRRLGDLLRRSSSGRELEGVGHADDVEWAAQLDVSECVPVLRDGRFVGG
jgi:2-phosphosulfolactate phosphatase